MKTFTLKFDLTNVEKLGCWEDFYNLIGLTAKKKELDEELKPAGKKVWFKVTNFYVSKNTYEKVRKIIGDSFKNYYVNRKGKLNSKRPKPLKNIPAVWQRQLSWEHLQWSPNDSTYPAMEDNVLTVEYEEVDINAKTDY